MTDPSAPEQRAGVRPEPPETEAPGPAKGSRAASLRAAAVIGALAVAALAAVYFGRRSSIDFGDTLGVIEQHLTAKHRTTWLAAFRAACAKHDCACARRAAGFGLDVDATEAVLTLCERARSCGALEFEGYRAEALVRQDDAVDGVAAAAQVLERSAKNPHALYARALASFREDKLPFAKELAEASERAGRGWSATLLAGLVAYRMGDLERAHRIFQKLVEADPDDVDALFNLGVTAQQQNSYGQARSNYLKVTRLDPRHADARHNLVILTHSFGATQEARHHFAKFQKLAPNDPRLGELRAVLATPPEHGPALSPGSSAAAPSSADAQAH
jgi:tetratricopeptide (TPR) repeat protein